MADELDQTIQDVAANPKRVTVDGNTAEQRSVREVIEADRYLASKQASRSTGLGLKLVKLSPGGTA